MNKKLEKFLIIEHEETGEREVLITYSEPNLYERYSLANDDHLPLIRNAFSENADLITDPELGHVEVQVISKEDEYLVGGMINNITTGYDEFNRNLVVTAPVQEKGKFTFGKAGIALTVAAAIALTSAHYFSLKRNDPVAGNNGNIIVATDIEAAPENAYDQMMQYLNREEFGLTNQAKVDAFDIFKGIFDNSAIDPELSYIHAETGEEVRVGFNYVEAVFDYYKTNQNYLNPDDLASLIGKDIFSANQIARGSTNNSGKWAMMFTSMFAQGKVIGDPTTIFENDLEKDVLSNLLNEVGKDDFKDTLKKWIVDIHDGGNIALIITASEKIMPAAVVNYPDLFTIEEQEELSRIAMTYCSDLSIFTNAETAKTYNVSYQENEGLTELSKLVDGILISENKHEKTVIDLVTGAKISFQLGDLIHLIDAYDFTNEVQAPVNNYQAPTKAPVQNNDVVKKNEAVKAEIEEAIKRGNPGHNTEVTERKEESSKLDDKITVELDGKEVELDREDYVIDPEKGIDTSKGEDTSVGTEKADQQADKIESTPEVKKDEEDGVRNETYGFDENGNPLTKAQYEAMMKEAGLESKWDEPAGPTNYQSSDLAPGDKEVIKVEEQPVIITEEEVDLNNPTYNVVETNESSEEIEYFYDVDEIVVQEEQEQSKGFSR